MENTFPRPAGRRPVIGLMSGSFHTDYSRAITDVIRTSLKEDDADLCLFQWLDASRYLDLKNFVDDGFDDHYYTQFEYSKFIHPDILIVSFGTISAIPRAKLDLQEFLASLPDVPVILLETEADLPGVITVTLDNYSAMHSLVDHMIEVHSCKEILYISGPKGVQDSEFRLAAYRDAMKEHGLTVDDSMIIHGDFTDLIENEVETLLSQHPHPEAIVCANDEMAECTYRVLKAHDLRPGIDVAVTGFDDTDAAALMDPPLTTVRQDFTAIAQGAVDIVRALLRGEHPQSLRVPLTTMYRPSCGCPPGPVQSPKEKAKLESSLLNSRDRIKQLTYEGMTTALLLRNLLVENISIHTFFGILGNILHEMGSPWSCIALLKAPVVSDGSVRTFVPEELRLHLLQKGSQVTAWSRLEAPVLHAGEVPFFWPDKTKDSIVIYPLFFGNVHYGVIMAEAFQENMLFYYTLSLELGTGLRYLYLALDHQQAQAALMETNNMLSYSASHDAMTGLLNRTGFMAHCSAFVRQYDQNTRLVAVMADLDHLKQINDSFGHDMGDRAIIQAADLLKRALPPTSPLGRTGGDEFTALFVEHEGYGIQDFMSRIREGCQGFNRHSGLPFLVCISAGCFSFTADQGSDLSALLKKADESLYLAKKNRLSSVIRPATGDRQD